MSILNKEEARKLLQKVISFSKADACEVGLSGSEGGNIRYARNAISTSGDVSTLSLSVTSTFGKKSGTATINEFDEAALKRVVTRSEELAQLAPENPEYMPLKGPAEFKEAITYVPATAAMTPDSRTEAVAKSITVAKEAKLEAAGFLENTTGFDAVMNSKGLFAYNQNTDVIFSITTRNEAGTASGYAARGYNDVSKLDTYSATKISASKANGSLGARAIEPGKYTVILEPSAAIVLLENLAFSLDARSADEGRSFLSKPGGKTKLGEKLMDERVTIYSDPLNPDLPTSTWAGDGQSQERINWIEKGVMKNLYYSRYWAEKMKVKSVPFPNGIIMEGGTASLEDLIKGTEKGVLVTRLWYIRSVDPQTLLFTGLTRDGTFYIEDGKIKFPIKNFRFNESPIIMLNNLEALGKPERTVSGESEIHGLIPPLKIRDFTFTSLSDAV